jgi:hypothetical protein
MNNQELGKLLLILGAFIILAGLIIIFKNKLPIFKYIGNLPGDIIINRPNLKLYFPITTSILISLIISFIFWLFKAK